MTGAELLARARAYLARPDVRAKLAVIARYAGAAAIIVGVLVLVASTCNSAARLSAEVGRLHEAAALRDAGAPVVDQVDEDAVEDRVAALERENADLKAALEEARRVAPGARPVGAATASTGRVTAGGAPRPSGGGNLAAVGGPGYAAGSSEAPASPAPPTPPSTPPDGGVVCLLAAGDAGEVRLDEVVLETGKGNRLLVGSAAAYRLSPTPTRLFGGPFRAPLTQALEAAPPAAAAPRWGAGPAIGAGTGGVFYGAALATPEGRVPLLGWRAGVVVIGGVGAGGAAGFATVVVRP